MAKKLWIALSIALMMSVGMTACGGNDDSTVPTGGSSIETPVNSGNSQTPEKPDPEIVYVDKDYVDVTAIGGTIKDKTYNHDKIEKDENVTVVAPETKGQEKFVGWYNGDTKVSDSAVYQFKATESVTLRAVYDGNTSSTWDGKYPEAVDMDAKTAEDGGYVMDEATATWHISSAAGLAYWAKLVDCGESGNPASYKFSAFNRGVYNITGGTEAEKLNAAYNGIGWTLSLECDIDLAGYEWHGLDIWNNALAEFTFEGNGHTISNMYSVTAAYVGRHPAAGFFAYMSDDFTIRNVTFDGAFVTSIDGEGWTGNRFCGVVVGYLNSNNYNEIFHKPNTVVMDNVNVINSYVGGQSVTKSGIMIGSSGQYAKYPGATTPGHADGGDDTVIVLRECTIDNCTQVANVRNGGFVGYMQHAMDADPAVGGQISIVEYGCTISNVTAISFGSADVEKMFGSLGMAQAIALDGGPQNYFNLAGEKNINRVLLKTSGKGLVFKAAEFKAAAERTGEENPVFIMKDMDISKANIDDLNEKTVIYVMEGVTVTGLDREELAGIEIRTIALSKVNAQGYATVLDSDGAEIGVWQEKFVAKEEPAA